jgi:hypothetical protein
MKEIKPSLIATTTAILSEEKKQNSIISGLKKAANAVKRSPQIMRKKLGQ